MFLSTIVQAALAFLKSVVIARSLGIEQYGIFAIIYAFVPTIQEIFNLNFGSSLVKFATDYRKQGRQDKEFALIKSSYVISFYAFLVSMLVLSLAVFAFYEVFFELPGLEWLVVLFALGSSTSFFNTLARVVLRINDKYKINSLINILVYTLEFGVICLSLYLFKNDLTMLIFSITAVTFLNFLIVQLTSYYEVRRQIHGFWRAPMSLLKDDRKMIGGFILNNSLSKTIQKLMKKGDVLILAAFVGPAQVGLYDVARKLAFSLLVIKDPIMLAVYPQLAKLIADDEALKIKQFLRSILLVGAIPFGIGITVLFFTSEFFIRVIYGAQFVGAGDALWFLMLAIGLDIIFFWSVPYILSLGMTGYRLRISLLSSAVTILLAFALVQTYTATGIAFAILVGGIMLNAQLLIPVYRHLQTKRNG